MAEQSNRAAEVQRKEIQQVLDQKLREIAHQEQGKQEEIEKLKKRETDLYKYKFKIKDLRKSKHVLTHRA